MKSSRPRQKIVKWKWKNRRKMKSKTGLVVSQLLLLLLINESHCFNLDVNNYISHEGQNGSMFGFSVALHQESQRSWYVIMWKTSLFVLLSCHIKRRDAALVNYYSIFFCGGDTLIHIFIRNASSFTFERQNSF